MSQKHVNDDVARPMREPQRRSFRRLSIALWLFVAGLTIAFIWVSLKLALNLVA